MRRKYLIIFNIFCLLVAHTALAGGPPASAPQATGAAGVEDDAYGAGWNGDTGNAPSQNAVYDKIETLGGSGDLLADGTVPLTANWDVDAYTITATRFISDIAIGTAPFGVTSTTVVTNLNADLLDGESASAFEDADADIAKTDANETISGNWTFSGDTFLTNTDILDNLAQLRFGDTDAPGSGAGDKDVGYFQFNYVDGAEDSENSDFLLYIFQGGSATPIWTFDESDDRWETTKDIRIGDENVVTVADDAEGVFGASGGTASVMNEATFKSTYNMEAGTDFLAPAGDGSSLTAVDAATGDSATDFFDAGEMSQDRIAGFGGSVTPILTLEDIDDAAGTGGVYANSSGGDNPVVMSIGVEEDGPDEENVEYIQLDGADEDIEMKKPVLFEGTHIDITDGVIFIKEQVDADADREGFGQLWVNTAAPNELYFTDDAGTDHQLGIAGSDDQTLAEVLAEGADANDVSITSGADIACDSISADAAQLKLGSTDEETVTQADGLPDSDDTYSCGMVVWLTAGNAVKEFDLVMMMADGKVDMANASGNPIGFAVEESNDGWPAADTESIGVCLIGSGGTIRNDGWTGHTASEIVYVVDAGGTDGLFDPADEIDLEDGDHWTAVGVMQEEDIIIFPVPAWATDDGT